MAMNWNVFTSLKRHNNSSAQGDPFGLCFAIAFIFWIMCLIRLAMPEALYFDEVHYVPAAREMLALDRFTNQEHPLLGKQIIAAGIALFGDNAWGWRIFPSLAGGLCLFAATRALWFASLSRFATIAFGLLLATGFHLFIHARIAMLDIFYIAFLCVAAWQCAAAMRAPERGRIRLAICGIALGLAMAAKWNAIPFAVLPGLAFLVLRAKAGRRRLLLSRRGAPVPGVTLVEAGCWLGAVPLLVYAASFWPGYLFAQDAIGIADGIASGADGQSQNFVSALIDHHRTMLDLQTQVIQPHPYQSQWHDWVINNRAIWYLYEEVDGVQRGVLLVGNPVTMILGLPALLWCAWHTLGSPIGRSIEQAVDGGANQANPTPTNQAQTNQAQTIRAPLAVLILYSVALGFWIVAAKPVQFYYHYLAASTILLAALALMLDALWRYGERQEDAAKASLAKFCALAPIIASLMVFVYFYPILSAASLPDEMAFLTWIWLDSWL
jgi:dolichyl-phosphate-mannose--protein O-mannosyl transferase